MYCRCIMAEKIVYSLLLCYLCALLADSRYIPDEENNAEPWQGPELPPSRLWNHVSGDEHPLDAWGVKDIKPVTLPPTERSWHRVEHNVIHNYPNLDVGYDWNATPKPTEAPNYLLKHWKVSVAASGGSILLTIIILFVALNNANEKKKKKKTKKRSMYRTGVTLRNVSTVSDRVPLEPSAFIPHVI